MIFFCPQTNSEFRKDRKVQPRNPNPGTVFIPQILKTRYFTLTHLGWESSFCVSLGSFQGADSQTSMGDHLLATTFHIHFAYGGGGDVPVSILLLYLWWSLLLLQFRIPIFTSFVAISHVGILPSWGLINPLSPNINKQILQTDLHTFPYRISWEKLIKDQRFSPCDHLINSHRCCTWQSVDIVRRKLMLVTIGT